jgi:hypothetical protein
MSGVTSIPLSSTGEVAVFRQADQMQPGRSEYECGFFGTMMARSMALAGRSPTLTEQQVIDEAEAAYAQYDGSYAASNTAGMTLGQLYTLLSQVQLHWQSTTPTIAVIKAWVAAGYPVIVAITEASVRDLGLGNINPYPWRAAGTHIILITGLASDGNVLVRDSANCVSLTDPHSLRPGPRIYNAAALQFVSATVAVPPWLPRPSSSTPPTTVPWTFVKQGGEDVGIAITDPLIERYFVVVNGNELKRKDTGVLMGSGITAFYLKYGGPGILRLPLTGETGVVGFPGVMFVVMEGCIIVWDPTPRQLDSPPTSEGAYLMHLDQGIGQQIMSNRAAQSSNSPAHVALQQIIATAQKALAGS